MLKTAKAYPNEFLAGVSINPQRRDAIEEVHRCADGGATLVKVLPNAQQFNPADPRYKAFYRTLAERKLLFLSHVGYEFSLIGKDQSLGDPNRLRLALDEGAAVIAAHACSYGLIIYEKFLPTLRDLVQRYPHFYSDISALTQPNRFRMLLHLRQYPEVHERLLFGTDYPLSVFHVAAWGRVAFGTSEAFVRAPLRVDGERGRLLGVEGAEPFVRPAGLAQHDTLGDELHDVDAVLDEVEVTGHGDTPRCDR